MALVHQSAFLRVTRHRRSANATMLWCISPPFYGRQGTDDRQMQRLCPVSR